MNHISMNGIFYILHCTSVPVTVVTCDHKTGIGEWAGVDRRGREGRWEECITISWSKHCTYFRYWRQMQGSSIYTALGIKFLKFSFSLRFAWKPDQSLATCFFLSWYIYFHDSSPPLNGLTWIVKVYTIYILYLL